MKHKQRVGSRQQYVEWNFVLHVALGCYMQAFHSNACNEEEEEEPLLIYTAQGSPFRRKKLSVINGSPEQQRTKTH